MGRVTYSSLSPICLGPHFCVGTRYTKIEHYSINTFFTRKEVFGKSR
jgi:hypothetical protein